MSKRSRTQRYHGREIRRQARRTARAAAGVAGAALAVWSIWQPFRVAVQGSSMAPELLPGDFLVGVRRAAVRLGSLVVVVDPRRPGFELVKRVAAVPGDVVGGGRKLGADEYWVVGSNEFESTDSRTFGPIRREAISGLVVARYWPPERMRLFRVAVRAT